MRYSYNPNPGEPDDKVTPVLVILIIIGFAVLILKQILQNL